MGQATVLSRMRTGDIRSIPLGFWLFAGAALLYAYLLLDSRRTLSAFEVLPFVVTVSPLIFAAAMAYAAPVDRRFLWGAALIGLTEAPTLVEMSLARFANIRFEAGLGLSPASLTWILEVAGVVLLASAMGGIKVQRNWIWLAIGMAIFVVGAVQNASFWATNPFPEEELGLVYPIESIAVSLIAGLTVIGWAYLLGAAIEHRHRAFAIASGIFVVLSAFGLVNEFLYEALVPAGNNEIAQLVYLPFAFARTIGWVVLIAAALTDVPRRNTRSEVEPAT